MPRDTVRVTLLSLCLLLAAGARAQTPQTPEAKTLSKAAASRVQKQHLNPAQIDTVPTFTAFVPTVSMPPPPPRTMPNLLWLNANEAAARLEPLHLIPRFAGSEDGIVIAQEPPPDADILVRIVPLMLGVPRLTLSSSTFNLRAGDDVTFTLSFDPPPPAPHDVTYRFQWHDGTEDLTTDQAAAAHRFAAEGNYDVSASAVIDGRLPATSNVVNLSVIPVPPTITDTMATEPAPRPHETPPPPARPLPWALILVVAIAAGALGFLVRAGTARSRVQPRGSTPAVSMKCGIGNVAQTIDHPETIRNPLALRLRCGIRSVAVEEGGGHA